MPKNIQTTAQLHLSHASKVMLKIFKWGFNSLEPSEVPSEASAESRIPDLQTGFGKREEPEIKLPTSVGSLKKQENSRKTPGEGNDHSLQYSCLENPMDGGAWQATVHGVTKSQTQLSDFTFQKSIYFCFIDYTKAFVWITTNCGKCFKRWKYQDTFPASWEICVQVKKQQLEWTWNNRLVPY